jgi:hypothetical protein
MKITTTIEVTKQEKDIIYNALQAYQNYLDKLSRDHVQVKLIDELIITTNELVNEFERKV